MKWLQTSSGSFFMRRLANALADANARFKNNTKDDTRLQIAEVFKLLIGFNEKVKRRFR